MFTVTTKDGAVYEQVEIVGSDNAGGLNLHLRQLQDGSMVFLAVADLQTIECVD